MVEQSELDLLIKSYIERFNINNGNYDNLSSTMKNHLYKIERYLQSYTSNMIRLSEEMNNSKLNLLIVTQKSGVPRSTIYNNSAILKNYVENRVLEISASEISPLNKISIQNQKLNDLKSYLEKVQYHLVETEILEAKIKELESEIKVLKAQEEMNTKEIHRLARINEQLLKESTKSKVVKLK